MHSPFEAPSKYTDLYNIENEDRLKYLAMVSALDEGVGNVTDTLKEAGMWKNTVFVFSTGTINYFLTLYDLNKLFSYVI